MLLAIQKKSCHRTTKYFVQQSSIIRSSIIITGALTQICLQIPHCGWPWNLNVLLLHKADYAHADSVNFALMKNLSFSIWLSTPPAVHCQDSRRSSDRTWHYTKGNYMLWFEHRVAHWAESHGGSALPLSRHYAEGDKEEQITNEMEWHRCIRGLTKNSN